MASEKKSLFDTVGGRRYTIAVMALVMTFIAVAFKWIDSAAFKEVFIWVPGLFIAGNTIEQVRGALSAGPMGLLAGMSAPNGKQKTAVKLDDES